jgi:hypothetical protein
VSEVRSPSSLVVTKDHLISARCEGVVMARLDTPLGAENGEVEPSLWAHEPDRIYTARNLVQHRREVPVRVLNATHRDQNLTKGFLLAHCEPLALVNSPDLGQLQDRDAGSKLHEVTEAARPHLSNGEF